MTNYERVEAASEYILERSGQAPDAALVLGSGLAGLETLVPGPLSISYGDIPHFPASSVEGHAARLVFGSLGGIHLWIFSGRIHYYEGYGMDEVTFLIRVIGKVGTKELVLTNAAGSLKPRDFAPGNLMLISDHINLLGANPLRGVNEERWGPRFLDQREVYDRALRNRMLRAAELEGVHLREGVYAAVSGPTYETPAEVEFLCKIGAAAVGMSTVPEAIVAHHMGIRLAAISVLSNVAAHRNASPITHDEVLAAGKKAETQLLKLLTRFFRERNDAPGSPTPTDY